MATITDTGPTPTHKALHVVGQRPDGSFEVFTMDAVPDGEEMDVAEYACSQRQLHFIHCARPRAVHY